MSKYTEDKKNMDEIADKLSERQDIWQDRYIYWIAVAIGHLLEWVVKHEHSNVADGSGGGTTDRSKGW